MITYRVKFEELLMTKDSDEFFKLTYSLPHFGVDHLAWGIVFENKLSEFEKDLFSSSLEEFKCKLHEVGVNAPLREHIICYGLMHLFRNIKFETFIEIIEPIITFTNPRVALVTANFDREDILKWLLSENLRKVGKGIFLNVEDQMLMVYAAAVYGSINVIKFLMKRGHKYWASFYLIKQTENGDPFCFACINNQPEIANLIFQIANDEEKKHLISRGKFLPIHYFLYYRNFDLLKIVAPFCPENDPILDNHIAWAFSKYAKEGRLSKMMKLAKLFPKKLTMLALAKNCEAFKIAFKSKNLKMVQFISRLTPGIITSIMAANNHECMKLCFKDENSAVSKYLLSLNPEGIKF